MAMRWQSSRPSVAAERGGAAPGGRCVCVCVGVWVGREGVPGRTGKRGCLVGVRACACEQRRLTVRHLSWGGGGAISYKKA
jgi:hypothetical protein